MNKRIVSYKGKKWVVWRDHFTGLIELVRIGIDNDPEIKVGVAIMESVIVDSRELN